MHLNSYLGRSSLRSLWALLILALMGSINLSCSRRDSGVTPPESPATAGKAEVKSPEVADPASPSESGAAPAASPPATPVIIPVTPIDPSKQASPAGQPSADSRPGTGKDTSLKAGKPVPEWQLPAGAATLVSPVKSHPNAAQIGRELYLQRCVDCHGKEGRGDGYLSKAVLKSPADLTSRTVQANSDGVLFWKITNGKSPMPANRARFTDEQRWYLVAYLRSFKS